MWLLFGAALLLVAVGVVFRLRSQPKPLPQQANTIPVPEKKKDKKAPKVDISASFKSKPKKEKETVENHNLLFTSINAHDGVINDFSLSSDCHVMLTVSADRTLRVWNWIDKHVHPVYTRISTQLEVGTACALSKDGTLAAVALPTYRNVQVYKVTLKDNAKEFFGTELVTDFKTGHKEPISSMIINPTHQFLLTASKGRDTSIKLFSPRTGTLLHQFDTNQISNNMACLSDDGRFLSVGTMLCDCRIWAVHASAKSGVFEGLEVCMSLKNHKKGVNCVSFWTSDLGSTDGAATASLDGNVRVWNLKVQYQIKEEPKLKSCFGLPDNLVPELVACAPGSSGVLAVSHGPSIFFFQNSGVLLERIDIAHKGGVTRLRWHSNGKVLASCGEDKHVKLWKSPVV